MANDVTAETEVGNTRRRRSSVNQPEPPPIKALDGGYGWVIVFASFINHVITDGICYTFGVFYIEFLDYFNESKGKTSLIGSVLTGTYLMSAPLVSALVDKFGCRAVAASGALIAAFGFAISRLSTSVNGLMITFGLIAGIGFGLLYLPSVVIVSYYFERRRALATGIAVCGAGVGTFMFAPLGRYLLTTLDWKNAVLIVAAITLQGCVAGFLFRPIESYQGTMKQKNAKHQAAGFDDENESRTKTVMDRLNEKLFGHRDSINAEGGVENSRTDGRLSEMRRLKEYELKRMDSVGGDCNVDSERPTTSCSSKNVAPVDPNELILRHSVARRMSVQFSSSTLQLPPSAAAIVDNDDGAGEETSKRSCLERFLDASGVGLLREPIFVIPFFANLFAMTGLYIPFYFITSRAIAMGVDQTWAAFLISIIGITNTFGRIVIGFIADLESVSPLLLHNVALLLNGVVCFLHMFCVAYPLMCIYSIIIGLGIAAWISLTPIVLCDLLGVNKLSKSFGLLNLTRGIAALVGPPIAGFVYDVTRNYDNSFHVAGFMFIAGGSICCLLHLPSMQRRTYAHLVKVQQQQ